LPDANKCFVINALIIANKSMLGPEWNVVKV